MAVGEQHVSDRRQFLKAGALAAGVMAFPRLQARGTGRARLVSTWDFGVGANQAAWNVLGNGGTALVAAPIDARPDRSRSSRPGSTTR